MYIAQSTPKTSYVGLTMLLGFCEQYHRNPYSFFKNYYPNQPFILFFKFYLFIYFGHTTRHVGSQFTDQGSNQRPLHWKCEVLTTGPLGKSPGIHILFLFVCSFFVFKFIFIFGCIGSLLLRAGFLQLQREGATLRCGVWASHCSGFSLLRSKGSQRVGFTICGTRAPQLQLAGSRAQGQQLWRTGLVAPRHVGSSPTRAQTRVPCIGRRILYHWPPGKSPMNILNMNHN